MIPLKMRTVLAMPPSTVSREAPFRPGLILRSSLCPQDLFGWVNERMIAPAEEFPGGNRADQLVSPAPRQLTIRSTSMANSQRAI